MVRGAAVVMACVGVCVAGAVHASATTGKNNGGTTTTTNTGGDGTSYTAHVTYTHRGTSPGDGSQQARSTDANFTPPVCWYTSFTPDQFKAEINRRYTYAGQTNEDTVYRYYNGVQSDMNTINYHKGDSGSWWVLTWDQTQLNNGNASCPYNTGWLWAPPANPPQGAISPALLAKAAYGQMTLPTKGVNLSPRPENQKVNLPTYVTFQRAGAQVSVTAQLTAPDGTVVAATVTAEPYSLRVDAGTSYASPGQCDYTLGAGGALNSAGAGCNITYTRASAGTYPFTADMTWHVWWTPTATAQPAGTPMADGFSQFPQDVTVQEIQAVNR